MKAVLEMAERFAHALRVILPHLMSGQVHCVLADIQRRKEAGYA